MTAVTQSVRPQPTPATAGRFLARFALLASLWLGLNGTDGSSWIVGGPAVFAATWISLKLSPVRSWRGSVGGAIAFAGYFIRESLRGGWDVAWRVLSPKLPVAPALVFFKSGLPPGAARVFFCGVISLLPGSAVVAIEQNGVRVHALNGSPRIEAELRELERRVAALFGQPFPDRKGGGA